MKQTKRTKQTKQRLVAFNHTMCLFAALLLCSIEQCFVQAPAQAQIMPVAVTLRMPNAVADIGDTVRIPIIAPPFTPDRAFQDSVRGIQFRIQYNPSVIALDLPLLNRFIRGVEVLETTLVNGLESKLIRAPRPPNISDRLGDTVAVLPFILYLGDAQSSPVIMVEPQWMNGIRRVLVPPLVAFPIAPPPAVITVRDAVGYNLLNLNPSGLSMAVTPNPVIAGSQIRLEVAAGVIAPQAMPDISLAFYDEQGRKVLDLTPRLRIASLARGGDTIMMTTAERPRPLGRNYYCRFTVGNAAITQIVRVQ